MVETHSSVRRLKGQTNTKEILENPDWAEEFLTFMRREHSEESFLFMLDVRKLQQLIEERTGVQEDTDDDEDDEDDDDDAEGNDEQVNEEEPSSGNNSQNTNKGGQMKEGVLCKKTSVKEQDSRRVNVDGEIQGEIAITDIGGEEGNDGIAEGGKEEDSQSTLHPEIRAQIEYIVNTYISETSDKKVHLQYDTTSDILSQIKTGKISAKIFDRAAKEIIYCLKTDSYMRFKINHYTSREC